ncbi:MAG TPA: TIGR03118 family protein [Terriglobales bacterium]|nr:TIGR03118 family protein [Terriglobales bacterium]
MGSAFEDHRLPKGYAPFNVQAIGRNIVVAWAKQDPDKKDELDGPGFGFVDVFTASGQLLLRLDHGSWFNAPWGIALAPGDFGEFSHSLLIGNFGGGNIAAFSPFTGHFRGNVLNENGSTFSIPGLWALAFGNNNGANNGAAGPYNTLFFTAGINGEADGLFGALTAVSAELNEEDEP